ALLPPARAEEILRAMIDSYPIRTTDDKKAKLTLEDYMEEQLQNSDERLAAVQGIEDQLDYNATNRLGDTPLMLGAQRGSTVCVAALLEEGETDVAAVNADGCTALVLAVMSESLPVARVLIAASVKKGGGVDQQTANGFTALHWAAVRGSAELAANLLDAGASLND
ncbi:unnamed protein product, partial [Discosporangium mesarthrocarpum]